MEPYREAGESSSRPARRHEGKSSASQSSKRKDATAPTERPSGRISLIDAMRIKLEEAEKNQKVASTERKECRFGKTVLPILDQHDPRGFTPLNNLPIDQQQKCLLDALWRARARGEMLNALCALQYYFSKIMEPPQGKIFSYYALLNGPGVGIYCYYSSLVTAKEGLRNPQYKGFYSFTDAINYIWDNVYDKNAIIFIEEEPRDGPLIETYQTELRLFKEQINELINEIAELKKPESSEDQVDSPTPHIDTLMTEATEDRRNPRGTR